MHATLTRDPGEDLGEYGDAGGGAVVLVRRLAASPGRAATCLRVWGAEEDARRAAGGEPVWEVLDHHRGRCAGEEPTAVQATWFDGPRSAEQVAADARAGRERIWPAVADADGLVDVLVLGGADGASVVLTSVTAAEHLEEHVRRIMSTELLPGEDPALLGGPDRVEVLRVVPARAGAR